MGKKKNLREEAYLQTWVIRILLNVCHTMQRKMARTCPVEEIREKAQPQQAETGLKEALLQLEEKYRMPILLHYIEGYGVKDVAAMLHIPQGTVKTRLFRGRKALEAILKEEVFEE